MKTVLSTKFSNPQGHLESGGLFSCPIITYPLQLPVTVYQQNKVISPPCDKPREDAVTHRPPLQGGGSVCVGGGGGGVKAYV